MPYTCTFINDTQHYQLFFILYKWQQFGTYLKLIHFNSNMVHWLNIPQFLCLINGCVYVFLITNRTEPILKYFSPWAHVQELFRIRLVVELLCSLVHFTVLSIYILPIIQESYLIPTPSFDRVCLNFINLMCMKYYIFICLLLSLYNEMDHLSFFIVIKVFFYMSCHSNSLMYCLLAFALDTFQIFFPVIYIYICTHIHISINDIKINTSS